MKLNVLLLFLTTLGLLARNDGYGQSKRIDLTIADASIIDVFNEIEKLSEFKIFYKVDALDLNRKYDVNTRNKLVGEILTDVLSGMNVSYELVDKIIVITPEKLFQQLKVTGKITDINGNPLPGVNIVEKGTTSGAVTDLNGNYSISVESEDAILVFSFVGYLSEEIAVSSQSEINVTLIEDIQALEEVVVVGYGTQQRKDLTGAVASVSSDDIGKLSFSDVGQAIQGKLSGVTIQQNTEPGGTADIRIRGLSTINNNNPLIVIDGIPSPNGLRDLNPNNISSIDVLKDASATAIYGNRASNGVIIVTTKKGKKGQKTKIDFQAEYGVANVSRGIDVLNAEEYTMIMNESIENAVEQGLMEDNINREMQLYDPQDTDWQDVIFRQGQQSDLNLSISGGSEQTSFYLSGGYRDVKGVLIESDYKRYSFTSNIEHNLFDRITIGENLHLSYSDRADSYTHTSSGWSGVMQQAVTAAPQFPVYHEGQFAFGLADDRPFYGDGNNPVWGAENGGTNHLTRVNGNAYVDVNILEGLDFKTSLGIDYSNNEYDNYTPPKVLARVPREDIMENRFSKNQNWSWYNTLTYSNRFGKNKITLLVGNSLEKSLVSSFSAARQNLLSTAEPFHFINFGDPEKQSTSGDAGELALSSQFGRFNYNFDERYLVTATIRRDGSSRFLENDDKYGIFPSVSVAWRVTQENFMQNITALDNMKIRFGWGKVGNQFVGSYYPYLDVLALNYNYPFGPGDGSLNTGIAEASRGNPTLTWESNVMTNIGLDLGFFGGKWSIVADYFINTTEDMLLSVALPAVGGNSLVPNQNAGSVETKGFEVDTRYHFDIGDFKFNVGLNASQVKNEVLDLAGSEFILGSAAYRGKDNPIRTVVGQPISTFFGYQVEGIFQTQDEVDNHASQEANTGPGDIKYKDINGRDEEGNLTGEPDGVIDDADRTYIGNGFPEFSYGFTFNAGYKNIDFLMFLQGVSGVEIYNALNMDIMHGGSRSNKHTNILDRWTDEGTSNEIPRVHYGDPNDNDRISDYFIESGDYLRIKNIQIGYTLPTSIMGNAGISSLRLYFSVQNPITFTDYTGANPDIVPVGSDADLNHGFDTGAYPIPRTFLFGLNLSL